METKICKQCKEEKFLVEFTKGRRICKVCRYLQVKKWNAANPDRLVTYSIRHQETQDKKRRRNAEAYRAYRRDYYQRHREHNLAYQAEYRKKKVMEYWQGGGA